LLAERLQLPFPFPHFPDQGTAEMAEVITFPEGFLDGVKEYPVFRVEPDGSVMAVLVMDCFRFAVADEHGMIPLF
ncbi:hypothetical protein NL341_28170, partial [Klebsiella pneumoniae]|nr:hypothetical protein [Klebsiella pneumoniae]